MDNTDISKSNPFTYDALPDASSDVRFLRVLENKGDQPVRCTLEFGNLGKEYICLSYTWGNDVASHAIMLGGNKFLVRDSLWLFLQQAQTLWTYDTLFWIDAICIDQGNDEEKNKQVAMMGEIYSGAQEVVAWLGAGDETTEKAVQFIARWGHADNRAFMVEGTAARDMKKHSLQPHQYLEAYYAIESAPYWSRLWIVQELLLAKNITLLYNHQRMPIECLEYVWQELNISGSLSENVPKKLERFYCGLVLDERIESRNSQNGRNSQDGFSGFARLVTKFRAHRCKDPLDRIFALRALDSDDQHIKVDYSTNKSDIFVQVLQFFNDEALISGFHLMQGLEITLDDIIRQTRSSDCQSWRQHLENFARLPGDVSNIASSEMSFDAEWSSSDMQLLYPGLNIDCGSTRFSLCTGDVLAVVDEASIGLLLRRIPPLTQSPITLQELDSPVNEHDYSLVALLQIDSDDLKLFQNRDKLEEQQESAAVMRVTLCNIDIKPGDCEGMVVNVPLRFHDQDVDISHDRVPLGTDDDQSGDDISGQSFVEVHLSWRMLLMIWQLLEKDSSMFKDIHVHETF